MPRIAVINVVGLTPGLIGPQTPAISAFQRKANTRTIKPALPAVTCTAQSNYLTGQTPASHGIVANGWYDRDLSEVLFWKQSNRLVQSPKIWDVLHDRYPGFTCANLFWWYNMVSTADLTVTPRPMYPADGRKVFDIYSRPYELRPAIKQELGDFPFPTFWGPAAGRQTPQGPPEAASAWIARSAQWTETHHQPSLSLVYLPHLDYNLQRLGPNHPEISTDLQRIDNIVGELLDFYQQRNVQVILLSEYGITPVHQPVHLNRLFRQHGWLTIKEELGLEILDPGASQAFAVADHQIAHIYLNNPSIKSKVLELCSQTPGIEQVLHDTSLQSSGLHHPRCGDIVTLSHANAWFTYYYWLDDSKAPDFARTVDIHRKPGYDPVELFLDPAIRLPKLRIAQRLLQKKLGFRMLMDVIPLDASLVKGSHGHPSPPAKHLPILITNALELPHQDIIQSTDVFHLILSCFT